MPPTREPGARLGEAFLDALSRRDFPQLKDLFHPQIRFRALVPPGLRTAEDAIAAAEHLGRWFGDADRFDVISSTVDRVGTRVRVSYRIHLREAGVWYTVEQQAYVDAKGDRIGFMDLLCSGFILDSDGAGDRRRNDLSKGSIEADVG